MLIFDLDENRTLVTVFAQDYSETLLEVSRYFKKCIIVRFDNNEI